MVRRASGKLLPIVCRDLVGRRGIGGGRKLGTEPSDVISGRDGIRSKIWSIRVEGTANNRPVQNLVGISVPNLKSHKVSNVFGEPNKISQGFR